MMLTADEVDLSLVRNAKIFHFGSLSMTDKICEKATKHAIAAAKEAGKAAEPEFDPTVLLRYIPPVPVKKRRTWLWVLGWIFCYPIPFAILIFRGIRYLYREYKRP